MNKDTRDHILYLLENDLEDKRYRLDRALIEGRDGVSELTEYKYSLLAKEDFCELRGSGNQSCVDCLKGG